MANENWNYIEKCIRENGSGSYFLVRIAEKGNYEIWRMEMTGQGKIIMEDNDSPTSAVKPVPWNLIATIKHVGVDEMAKIVNSLLKVNYEMLGQTAIFFMDSQAKIEQILTS